MVPSVKGCQGAYGGRYAWPFAGLACDAARRTRPSPGGKTGAGGARRTCSSVKIAFVDQGYTGDTAANEAGEHGVELHVVKLPEANRGFVLLG